MFTIFILGFSHFFLYNHPILNFPDLPDLSFFVKFRKYFYIAFITELY